MRTGSFENPRGAREWWARRVLPQGYTWASVATPSAHGSRLAPRPGYVALVRHLYVHIPFCVRRCSYCDFSIAVRKRIPAREYVASVQRELQLLASGDAPAQPGQMGAAPGSWGSADLETLYLGGGTPSLLGTDALGRLVGSLLEGTVSPAMRDAVEVTLEANPEDVTPAVAREWRRLGVNRVSLGAQSFDDGVLRWMHRSHTAARIGEAMRALRAAGIDNVSLDLIFALPAELRRDWPRDVDHALSLVPAHVSLYGLTVEERTPLARWITRGATSAPDDEGYATEYLTAHRYLEAAGYHFYEVSNACRPGFRSRHNWAYWTGGDYVGLGPAAHSFDGRVRRWNVAQWTAYHRAIEAGRSPTAAQEMLTPEQRQLERAYLALRTAEGLPLTTLDRARPALTAWARQGWIEEIEDRVRCTPDGWLRLDALVRDLTGPMGTV